MSKTKLSCHDWSDQVWYVIKTRWDNDVTDHIGMLYTENETRLLWLIELGTIYDKNQTKKWCDWSYKYGIRRKWNQIVVTTQLSWQLVSHNDFNDN